MKLERAIVSSTIEIEVPFFDVDSMQITWHGNYLKYFELARCALLEKIDYDYIQMKGSGYLWPIVDLRIKFILPTKFKQKILVEATLVEYECRIKIKYIVYDALSKKRLTQGYTIQLAINSKDNSLCFSSPACFLEKLKPYLDSSTSTNKE